MRQKEENKKGRQNKKREHKKKKRTKKKRKSIVCEGAGGMSDCKDGLVKMLGIGQEGGKT